MIYAKPKRENAMKFTLDDNQYAQFEKNGFVLGGPVLDADVVDNLTKELDRVITNRGDSSCKQPLRLENINGKNPDRPVWQVVNIWQVSEAFESVMKDYGLSEVVAKMLGSEEIRIFHDQIQYKPKETGGVNSWHQDWPYWPLLSQPNQVTAWIALDDADESNGCMSMVKGSHKWGNQIDFLHEIKDFDKMPKEFDGHKLEVVRCPVKKGSVHFHDSMTWHGSKANTSQRPRRAIAFHYMGEKTNYLSNGNRHPCEKILPDGIVSGNKMHGDGFPLLFSREEVGV